MIVGSETLMLDLKCPRMLCLRRILGFYIHEHTLCMVYLHEDVSSSKFKTHFNKP